MAKTTLSTAESTRELQRLIKEFVNLKNTANGSKQSIAEMKKIMAQMNAVSGMTAQQFRSISASFEQNTRALKGNTAALRSVRTATDKLTNAQNKQSNASKKQATEAKKTTGVFSGLASATYKLFAAFGIVAGFQLFGAIIKDAFELTKTFDSLNFTMEKITKNFYDASTSTKFLKEITRDFGVDLVTTTTRYIKFLAAAQQSGVTIGQTEDIFRSMTKAASVLGLKTDELSGIYLALEQMLSKGKVTTEELRRQLGERLPGAMGIMAGALEVTISQLDKMLKKGEVLSADALPKFARAVELAYGISTVNKVDTLVAAQNRLSNSWKNFIETVTEGDTKVKVFLKTTMNYLARVGDFFSKKWAKPSQKLELIRIENTADIKKSIDFAVRERLKAMGDGSKKIEEYQDEIDKLGVEKIEADTKLKKDAIQSQIDELTRQRTIALNKIIEEEKNYALLEIKEAKRVMKDAQKIYEEYRLKQEGGVVVNEDGTKTGHIPRELTDEEQQKFDDAIYDYGLKLERWDILRKKIDEPGVSTVDDDGSGDSARATKTYKPPKDKTNEIIAENLQGMIDSNKKLIDSDTTTFELRKKLIDENVKYELTVNGLLITDKKKNLEDEARYEIERLNATIADSKETAQTKINAAEQIKLVEKELEDDLTLLKLEGVKNRNEIESKAFDETMKFTDEEFKRFEKEIADKKELFEIERDMKIKALREEGKTKKQIEDEMAKYDEEAFEKQQKALLQIIDTWIALGVANGIATAELEKFKAKLESMSFDSSADEEIVKWQEFAQLMGEVAGAIFNIGDAMLERRIENINAEIEAERAMYDKKIQMAGDNEKMREALELERDDKLRLLEKKRLKEEQKQAKLRKAQAIVDIAINTAIGISDALKKSFLGIPLVPVIAALGAMQIAAVLAQPIPQYAEGLSEADRDHIAMINDGGRKEYVERNGQILSTNTRNAIVGLKKGDTVHKDYDSMIKNSNLLMAITNGQQISENDFNRLEGVIEKSFEKGFKSAKINNTIKLNTNNSGDAYKQSLSKWS